MRRRIGEEKEEVRRSESGRGFQPHPLGGTAGGCARSGLREWGWETNDLWERRRLEARCLQICPGRPIEAPSWWSLHALGVSVRRAACAFSCTHQYGINRVWIDSEIHVSAWHVAIDCQPDNVHLVSTLSFVCVCVCVQKVQVEVVMLDGGQRVRWCLLKSGSSASNRTAPASLWAN